MAQERYTRTNQKIYFAGLTLDNWRKAEQGHALDALARAQAEQEACLFHLQGALLGLCHEIFGYYRFPLGDNLLPEQILRPVVLETARAPELSELLELATASESWLAALLARCARMQQPPSANEAEWPALQIADVEEWRRQLKALILRFRESMTEW